MQHPIRTEQDAIQRALTGDREALEQLLLARYDWLASVAHKSLPAGLRSGTALTEEILQESFVRILRGYSNFTVQSGEPGLFLWLKTIVHNTARDFVRKQRRSSEALLADAVPPRYSDDDVADFINQLAESNDPRASAVARGNELIRAFRVALSRLDPTYQQVIDLLYFQHRSVEEAAREMDVSAAAIRGYRGRARDKIREALVRLSNFI